MAEPFKKKHGFIQNFLKAIEFFFEFGIKYNHLILVLIIILIRKIFNKKSKK